ncbi:MAG: serine/threonine-protein phosphatase [Oscillospiraceae bacterium]|nr:serine/threonine-protein phosphatase [Oscillospiraceae bacterium]
MPAYFWSSAGFSRKGERPNNEDNYFLDGILLPEGEEDAVPRTAGLRSRGVLAVFDGMGGEQAGEYASFTAADLLRQKKSGLLGVRDQEAFRSAVQAYVGEVNGKLRRRGGELQATVGAAMAMLLLRGREAMFCNLGDCRIYCLRKGKLSLLTRDHTLAAFLQRRGDLTPEEARADPRRHALMRHMGSDQGEDALQPFFRRMELETGDRFLLCSDGVSGCLEETELTGLLGKGKPAAAAKALTEAAIRAGSRDNLTALCVQVQLRLF